MLQIENVIVSPELWEKKFLCDLPKCLGLCCVEGDAGAPLEEDETHILAEIYPKIKKYISEKGIAEIEKNGFYVIDTDGDYTTPLIEHKECAYTYFENGIAKCAIEKAYLEKKINFPKPVSCHLYPIRISNYELFDAVNYHKWYICKSAVSLGYTNGIPVYVFLKAPLIRKYGEKWYKLLEIAIKELQKK